MNLSLMSFQMMRVISSPSNSTTGFFTLIFLKVAMLRWNCGENMPMTAGLRGACVKGEEEESRERVRARLLRETFIVSRGRSVGGRWERRCALFAFEFVLCRS
jgi:hypothetical protein